MIESLAETGSTSADLAARLRAGEAVSEGHWLIADRQTAGRGRQGREWFDGTGNFMGSTVVRPGFGDAAPGSLALVAGLAVFEVVLNINPPPLGEVAAPQGLTEGERDQWQAPSASLRSAPPPGGEEFLRGLTLKWPNDLLIGRAKLAGILLEREGDSVIVGIGVNLASAPDPPDRKAVALSAFGPAPDRNAFAEALARQFAIELERWRNFGLEAIITRWQAAAHPIGTPLAAQDLTGTFAGLTPEGHLQLRLADGELRTIHAGEINFAD